ncbi:hypothetical protein QC762_302880 [Podospora pseudocomata]|uniref:Uncharacterized protein n=1 Tax=Podospora pseudocomata TaxID=2093779 RepID=A0ABR0GIT9_9PEZI|nr:hypothetical protein QC762_302880 [Podospora pseudocomata]
MKSIFSLAAAAALVGLSNSTPVPDATAAAHGPYHISGFFASKPHLSSGCRFEFNLTSPTLPSTPPVYCWASVELGFSGATWLGYVYQGLGHCDNERVDWTFNHPRGAETDRNDAVFNVTVDGVLGTYRVPKEDIYVNLNDEGNPFDNDVSYSGPREFEIVDFPGGD